MDKYLNIFIDLPSEKPETSHSHHRDAWKEFPDCSQADWTAPVEFEGVMHHRGMFDDSLEDIDLSAFERVGVFTRYHGMRVLKPSAGYIPEYIIAAGEFFKAFCNICDNQADELEHDYGDLDYTADGDRIYAYNEVAEYFGASASNGIVLIEFVEKYCLHLLNNFSFAIQGHGNYPGNHEASINIVLEVTEEREAAKKPEAGESG